MTDPWTPFRFGGGRTLPNRFLLAPMTTDASDPDGMVSAGERAFVRRRSLSGFGGLISSCAYVHEDGRSWNGIGAAKPGHLPSLEALAGDLRAGGGLAILQIYDGGRIARPALIGEGRMRAPSAVASLRPGALTPREMTGAEVDDLVGCFGAAAERARQAGFDGVELHGANHYLLHQFFSPRANRRRDRWGGDRDARMRFPLAVVQAAREAVGPGMVLGYRITPFEPEPDGYGLDDALALVDRLAGLGLDYIHVSLDDFRLQRPQREDRNYMVASAPTGGDGRSPLAEIRAVIAGRCAVVACGGVGTLADARAAMAAGGDLVAVGRAPLIDPDWLRKLADGREADIALRFPHAPEEIAARCAIPPRMVDYLLSRPGWIKREDA
ncbi:NADH:flavin oxidoreductase [Bosea sp. (in: a-proteobacteria)]|uniref:oxidoreductase n=1 Tax=Bosea sp. (in: a-proteobacteria) TaxID=1871050 RepID=UPI003F6F764A